MDLRQPLLPQDPDLDLWYLALDLDLAMVHGTLSKTITYHQGIMVQTGLQNGTKVTYDSVRWIFSSHVSPRILIWISGI